MSCLHSSSPLTYQSGLSFPTLSLSSCHQVWGAEPGSVWFVGDSIDDMVCGKLAGCRTCLIITEDNTAVIAQTQYVDLAVHSLRDFGLHIGLDL
jgi:phosphoglycolate phosphatase-like HAD superfamily hydrolase